MDDGTDINDKGEVMTTERVRNFYDVTGDNDYVKAIESALDMGVLTATSPEDCFYPMSEMTREDAAVILVSAFKMSKLGADYISKFDDTNKIDKNCYDALNIPILRGDTLVIDTGCGLVCDVPLSLCRQAVEMHPDSEEFLSMPEARGLLTSLPPNGRRLLAGILLNRIWAFFHQKADIVMGNPPWVNWEYLSPRYRAGSQHFWGGIRPVAGERPPARFFQGGCVHPVHLRRVGPLSRPRWTPQFYLAAGHLPLRPERCRVPAVSSGRPRSGFSGA